MNIANMTNETKIDGNIKTSITIINGDVIEIENVKKKKRKFNGSKLPLLCNIIFNEYPIIPPCNIAQTINPPIPKS